MTASYTWMEQCKPLLSISLFAFISSLSVVPTIVPSSVQKYPNNLGKASELAVSSLQVYYTIF